MPHIIERLHQDHEKVEQLFEKLLDTGDGAEKSRRQLCEQLAEELKAHSEFEEEVFYPAVRDAGGKADDEVDEALEEHEEVKQMLDQIESLDPTSEEFLDLVMELRDAVQEHVRREEAEIFPMAKDAIEQDAAQQMTERHDKMAAEHAQHASR